MENKINELNCWVVVLILMLFWFIIYSWVQVNKLNKRIDTTQQLVMEIDNDCPVITGKQMNEAMLESFDSINVMHDMLVWIDIKTDEIKNIIPSYIYKQPNEYDGKICDDANYCQRYLFIDDQPYNESTTNS